MFTTITPPSTPPPILNTGLARLKMETLKKWPQAQIYVVHGTGPILRRESEDKLHPVCQA